jgi:thioester reductase-like protein
MAGRSGIFLTGATGQLGRHLLRELLAGGHRVAVLVRGDGTAAAGDRVRELHEEFSESHGRRLRTPTVVCGDLRSSGLGLSDADRAWLSRRCATVVHAAACVSFRTTPDGEPHETNTGGTRRLLELCGALCIQDIHHVSTAFVCGEQTGPVLETERAPETAFHNEYERSKHAAELLLRGDPRVRATIYRPSVIVGDSRTGHTSTYHGVYRFLELADRLAQAEGGLGKRGLPLRLPFRGDELRNLVPVNWVAQAITRLVGQRRPHGRLYHLTAPDPTCVRDITEVAVSELNLAGVELAGPGPLANPSDLERAFLDGLREYWPYLGGDPAFDCRNTLAALPDLPAPRVDRGALGRLIRFAIRDRWGRSRRTTRAAGDIDCAEYIERFFPGALSRSVLSRVLVETTLGFSIRGPGGGRWVCRLGGGRVLAVERESASRAEVEYRMDVRTFAAIVSGRETPQAAFFGRRVEIAGGIERGLKLAALFRQFVREFPFDTRESRKERHAAA